MTPSAGAATGTAARRAPRTLGAVRTAIEARAGAALEATFNGFSAMPWRYRRTGLKLFFAILKPLGTGAAVSVGARDLSRILALSTREARRFAYRKTFHHALFVAEWAALGRRSVAGLIRDSRHISTDHAEDFGWLAQQRGAIIGTMHFGPYSLGLVWLLHTYFRGRRIIIFKTGHDTAVEHRAVERLGELGATVEFVAPEAIGDFHRLIKEVRRGAVVIIMVDLPPTFGRSDELDLMGHRISIASGAADLAAMSQAPLMLLRVRETAGGDRLEVGDVFDVARDPASRTRAVAKIGRFVSDTLHDHPDQWHMWSRFGEYLPARKGEPS